MAVHVATVHWNSDRWVDLQLDAIERHIPGALVYAFLNGLPTDRSSRFFYSSTEPIVDHPTKLNLLADMASLNAESDDDILVFLDGDAFPVAPLEPLLDRLARHRLIAVQMRESNGDLQPHPCFCVTTVGFWRKIKGDWHAGAVWVDGSGDETTDAGGNLLAILERNGVDWLRLHRLNRLNPHPILFGLYGDETPIVYHHCAGFRYAYTKVGMLQAGSERTHARLLSRMLERLPDNGVAGKARYRLHPVLRLEREVVAAADRLSDEWFARLSDDPSAWRALS